MMILLVFTLYLITGTGNSFEVIGYSGGSVIIQSDLLWSLKGAKYICKAVNGCADIINDQSGSKSFYEGRFSLNENTEGKFTVWIKDLKPEDAAKYEFGVKEEKSSKKKEIELKVEKDCCGGTAAVNTYLGENVTVECKYPDLFEENDKVFFKLENRSFTEISNTGKPSPKVQRGRFSISEDRSSKAFSLRISNMTEDDGGVYFCGVWKSQQSDGYYSLYTQIQLQVTAPGSHVFVITTIVCVCVALLLIIGLAVIIYYVKHKKRQGSTPSSKTKRKDHEQDPSVVCNYAEVKHSRNASAPTNTSDEDAHSTEQPPKDSGPTYAAVSFQKNPAVSTDAPATLSKEEPATMYGAIRHSTGLE
ncbi:hypothetical protein SRHO_G00178230 [Serrasalmus rhombeus]